MDSIYALSNEQLLLRRLGTLMKKRMIILAVLHFSLMLVCVVFSAGASLAAFEDPDYESSAFERLVAGLADILMLPGSSLWASNLPDALEWGLCLLNSLLWGLMLALLSGYLVETARKTKNV